VSDVRVRPAVRRLAITAFVILLPFAAHSVWDYIELRRLVSEIESIKAKGEPVSEPPGFPALPPDPSGKPTAAGYYLAASMLALEAESSAVVTPVQEWFAAQAPDPKALQTLAVPLAQLVDGTREAVSLADKAAALPFNGFPGGTEFSYRASGMAHLWSLINARTLHLSASGNGDGAVVSMLTGLKLRDGLREGSWFAFPEDRQVAAILSLTRPSSSSLQQLADALAREGDAGVQVDNFLQQRARYVGTIWRRYYGTDPSAPSQYSLPMRSITETVLRPWITHQTVDMLQVWAELARVAKMPWPEKVDARARLIDRLEPEVDGRSLSRYGWLSRRSIPVAAYAQVADATPLIIDRSSRVAVAIERFERDRNARPALLTELVPQYLAAIPADPYTGGPLRYLRAADRYTIYSVGPNKKDDAGDLRSEFDAAVARGQKYRRIRGTDIGVTILTRP